MAAQLRRVDEEATIPIRAQVQAPYQGQGYTTGVEPQSHHCDMEFDQLRPRLRRPLPRLFQRPVESEARRTAVHWPKDLDVEQTGELLYTYRGNYEGRGKRLPKAGTSTLRTSSGDGERARTRGGPEGLSIEGAYSVRKRMN